MHEKHYHTIGIIGGAGVAAAAELVSRIEKKITDAGAFRDAHHPELILFQATKVPSRSMYLEGRGESFIPGYINVAQRLETCGATILAMCCNTAHCAHNEIQNSVAIPLINLIEESFKAAKKLNLLAKKIGIMCSDGTRQAKIFEKFLNKDYDYTLLYPDKKYQNNITEGICNIKKALHRKCDENHSQRPQTLFYSAYQNLIEKGADIVILGCTEIPLDFALQEKITIPVIDTIDVLAQCCIKEI